MGAEIEVNIHDQIDHEGRLNELRKEAKTGREKEVDKKTEAGFKKGTAQWEQPNWAVDCIIVM